MKNRQELLEKEIENLKSLLLDEKKEPVGTKICANCQRYSEEEFEDFCGIGKCNIWGIVCNYSGCSDYKLKQD